MISPLQLLLATWEEFPFTDKKLLDISYSWRTCPKQPGGTWGFSFLPGLNQPLVDKDGEYVSAVLGRRDCSATEGESTWISRQGCYLWTLSLWTCHPRTSILPTRPTDSAALVVQPGRYKGNPPGLNGSPWQVSVGADLPIKPLSPQ